MSAKSAKKSAPVAEQPEVIVAYKGFDAQFRCNPTGDEPFQYEVGKEYTHSGAVKACATGFHACEFPLDVFNYYAPADSRFAVVEQSGKFSRDGGDTKVASSTIRIKAEIGIPALITAAFEYVRSKCAPAKDAHATGDQSASSATGYRSASSATGDRSASSATGNRSASSATGYQSASSATGNQSASSATGYQSASSATGDRSASSATGYQSASSATGDQSASSATGYRSASSATGSYSTSEITPDANGKALQAVACGLGYMCKARAPAGSAIVLVHRDDSGAIVHIRASKVGDNGVKADTWYSLDASGEFVEAA